MHNKQLKQSSVAAHNLHHATHSDRCWVTSLVMVSWMPWPGEPNIQDTSQSMYVSSTRLAGTPIFACGGLAAGPEEASRASELRFPITE
jgi:hypothetical protein